METKIHLRQMDSVEALIARYGSPETADAIRRLAAKESTVALVVFENANLDSSACGDNTVVAVGPTLTCKSVAEAQGRHLNDLPSQRQYPIAYWAKES